MGKSDIDTKIWLMRYMDWTSQQQMQPIWPMRVIQLLDDFASFKGRLAGDIIRGFLDAPRDTYFGIEHPDELVASAERWIADNVR